MYKVKDNVIYNGHKCFIGQVLGDGRYTVIGNNRDFVIEVYEKDLDPYFVSGDKVSLVGKLKGGLLEQQFLNIDINNMEVLATSEHGILIKGIGVYYPSSMFKHAPKPRCEVRHVIYDTVHKDIVNDAMGECYITLEEAQKACDEMNSPKVMKPKYTKEVEYFGMKLLIPDDAKIIVAHKDGGIFVSNENCCVASSGWLTGGYLKHICNVDLNGIDWKETLVEIK